MEKQKRLVPLEVEINQETKIKNLVVEINGSIEHALEARLASFYPKIIKYGSSKKFKNEASPQKIARERRKEILETAPEEANAYLPGASFMVRDIQVAAIDYTIEAINYYHINQEQVDRYFNSLQTSEG